MIDGNAVKWLGITLSPAYVGEPECNGAAERFIAATKPPGIRAYQGDPCLSLIVGFLRT